MSRFFSFVFGFGLLGAIITTWIAPKIISLLFTPPVSFGINCEPAASWASSKLVTSQVVGLVGGFIGGAAFVAWRKVKDKKADAQAPVSAASAAPASKA